MADPLTTEQRSQRDAWCFFQEGFHTLRRLLPPHMRDVVSTADLQTSFKEYLDVHDEALLETTFT